MDVTYNDVLIEIWSPKKEGRVTIYNMSDSKLSFWHTLNYVNNIVY